MIRQKPKNKETRLSGIRLRNEPYLIINCALAGVIVFIFAYFLFFSPVKDNYPVACIHEKITGQSCVSCGLSHSLSLILRGRIIEASEWNTNGLRIFIFFASQLLLRIVFSIYYIKFPLNRKLAIVTDSTGSALMVILAFWPFLRWMIEIL